MGRGRSLLVVPIACASIASVSSVAADARADHLQWAGGHADYGIGGAVGADYGFRQDLDVGLLAGKIETTGSSIGMWDRHEGTLFGASGIIGFGAYPSYVAGEIGYGKDTTLAGAGLLVGPVVRVDSSVGAGAGARLVGSILVFEAGLRLVAITAPHAEAQLTFTIGLGVY